MQDFAHECPSIQNLRVGREFYLISAKVCAKPPGFKAGVAPDRLATHAPTRLAVSLISLSDVPRKYPCTMAAVNASPAPTVSATFTLKPGCSLNSSADARRLPLSPRVTQTNFSLYLESRQRTESFSPRCSNPNTCMILGSSSWFSLTMVASFSDSANTSGV